MRHFSEDELRHLIRRREDQHLELKGSLRDPRTAAKELASLANSGRGLLVVGVHEGRDPIGIPNLDRERRLLEEGRSSISPPLSVDVATPTLDGHQLLIADVQGGDGPYISPDGAIVRRSRTGSTVAFSGNEFRKLLAHRAGGEADDRVLDLLEELNRRLNDEAARAENERRAAQHARSWRGQWQGWLISGAVGAVLGLGLSAIFA